MYNRKAIPEYDLNCIFEDAIDTALAVDDNIDNIELDDNSSSNEEDDEIVDTNMNYIDDEIDNSIEGADADDIIAAERDIAFDPFEDDEIIDIAIGSDKDNITQDVNVNELVDDI